MTHRLDPHQLEQVWDARVLGHPFPLPIEDADEKRLLDLFADVERPLANPAFVRALERQLTLGTWREVASPVPARLPTRKPPATRGALHSWSRLPARWIPGAFAVAVAAVALLVLLSAVALLLPRSDSESEWSIPAASQWTEAGPPTSPGVETTPIFSHAFAAEDLASFSMDQWGWVERVRGTVGPGARSFEDLTRVNTNEIPGISVISVYSGQLDARLVNAAVVYRQNGAITETGAGPAEISIGAGDTLVFGAGTLAELWNPTDKDTAYIAGGLYTKPGDPVLFTDDRTRTLPQGISFQASLFAGVSSLELSTDRVVVEPGQTFAYSITPQTLFLASIVGDGLEKQEWVNGEREGNERTVVPSSYSFHQDGPGYYTLTNNGTEPVEIQLFIVSPEPPVQSARAPANNVETLISRSSVSPKGDSDEFAQLFPVGWNVIPGLILMPGDDERIRAFRRRRLSGGLRSGLKGERGWRRRRV